MGLNSALLTGVSGIKVNTLGMEVSGDNIANVNTLGFKRSSAAFEDVLSRSLVGAGGFSQVGLGSQLTKVEQNFDQGSLTATNVPTDLAFTGNGFFVVEGVKNGTYGLYYTRVGNFRLDKDGYLSDPSGLKVQGYNANIDTGDLSKSVDDLQLGKSKIPPKATTKIQINMNLNADEARIPVGGSGNAFDINNIDGTTHFKTAMTTYDSLGNSHNVDVVFTKIDAGAGSDNTWEWHALTDTSEVTDPPPPPGQSLMEIGSGRLVFTSNGKLDSETQTVDPTITFSGAQPQNLDFDFGNAIVSDIQGASGLGDGLGGTTQYSTVQSTVGFQDQDGWATGDLVNLKVESSGDILGTFTNGIVRRVGSVVVAKIQRPEGLAKAGSNLYQTTNISGPALLGSPGVNGRGGLVSGALEQSNVDLSHEFVDLILYQRGFQANSKTVQTADQLLQELINLKR